VRTVKRRQGAFVLTFIVVSGLLTANTLRQRLFAPVYEGGFEMQIVNPFEMNGAGVDRGNGGGDSGLVESIARGGNRNDLPNMVRLLRSPLLIAPIADQQAISMQLIMRSLRFGLPQEGVSNVLAVSLRWDDPVKGKQILDALSRSYVAFSQVQRQEALDSGVRFLGQQAPELLARMDSLQDELRRFRVQYGYLDPTAQSGQLQSSRDNLTGTLRDLQRQQATLASQLASTRIGRLQLQASGAPSADQQLGPAGLATAPRTDLRDVAASGAATATPLAELQMIEKDLASARATFKESSPTIAALKARRAKIMPVVQRQTVDSLTAALLANGAQQDEVNRQILLLDDKFRASPQRIKEYESLQQRLAVARENYTSYIRAREAYRLEQARSTTPWKVIAPADFNPVPVEPDLQQGLVQALLLGLVAATLAAYLRDRTDRVFHTPEEAEKALQLPVLGLIPFLPLEPGKTIAASLGDMGEAERFAIKESLRGLFTTFRMLRADSQPRLIGITSSTQGEGRSTAVAIFATTLADLGLRVLVVDGDLRLPNQQKLFGLEKGEGFTSLLLNPALQAADLIQPVNDHLDLLLAGPKVPDPARLLNSERCREVVNQIRQLPNYDLILVDTPPCLLITDASMLGEQLDGMLFLVGLGKVRGDMAPQACRRIEAAGIDLLGTICNQQILPTRLNDYGHEYGYVHHYATTSSPEPTWEKALGERMQPQLDRLGHLLQRKSVK
jgi:capsular exopolysaccharide synthesis family protein